MATTAITLEQDVAVEEIFIAAVPARVFDAITDPNQMPQWWGRQGIYRVTEWRADVRLGGRWSCIGVRADGSTFTVEGEYIEVDPPHRLVHTWISSWTGPRESVVRWELEPQVVHGLHPSGPRKAGTGTRVKISQQGFVSAPDSMASHAEGWKRVLGWLHDYLEQDDTVETTSETTRPQFPPPTTN
jgi:uncharacterized protein YndB with AHSA1/START domain